jgi:hypothetical protein
MRALELLFHCHAPNALTLLVALALPGLGCEEPVREQPAPVDAGADTGADAGMDASVPPDVGPNELPCDVRAVIEDACLHCHSSPPTSGAPVSLVSRFDFLAPGAISGQSIGERSVVRMSAKGAPMPPISDPPAAPEQIAIIEQWVAAGMPAGQCGIIPSKPAATSCLSGQLWMDGDTGGKQMNPGLACRSCHLLKAPEFAFFFAGTVFPSFHEADLCYSPPPEGARIELLDESNNITLTLFPNGTGNFLSSAVVPGVPLPYRARLVANGLTRSMQTPQKDGDCNGCHTEQGDNNAPGRLVWPRPHSQ